jgi:hypothetical protein
MRFSIIFPSHRLAQTARIMKSLKNLSPMVHGVDYEVVVACQDPLKIQDCHDAGVDKIIPYPAVDISNPMPIVEWRAACMEFAQGDYFLMVDHDHMFQPKGKWPSSGDYLLECLDWMDNNQDVGSLGTNAFFGGAAWKDKFVKNPANALVAIVTGLWIRNVPEAHATSEERKLVGVLDESLWTYKMMAAGYTHAKRFYNPTKFDNFHTRVNVGTSSYSKQVIDANIGGYIQRKWSDPTWQHESRKYPKGVLRDQAYNRGE